jgi:dolichol-phosphate mannosyltransferase
MPDPVDLSLVIPVYNERDNLAPLVGEIVRALRGRRYEIVAVNDGSTDGSLEALKELKRAHPVLHIVSFAANAGQTAANAAGFEAARGTVIVTLDARASTSAGMSAGSFWPSASSVTITAPLAA